MPVKIIALLSLSFGLTLGLPPVPELPIADTGIMTDTGVTADTGELVDTGDHADSGSPSEHDTGTTDDENEGPNDTGTTPSDDTGEAPDTAYAGESGKTMSASERTGEEGGCSATGAMLGPWLFGLLGVLARRRL